jgi:protein-arginine kinase activator protein McsA
MIYQKDFSCKICGMMPEEFVLKQKMGCPFCYLFMENEFGVLIKGVQDGAEKHIGKRPNTNIIKDFLLYIIDKKSKESGKIEECGELSKLIVEYFGSQQ